MKAMKKSQVGTNHMGDKHPFQSKFKSVLAVHDSKNDGAHPTAGGVQPKFTSANAAKGGKGGGSTMKKGS